MNIEIKELEKSQKICAVYSNFEDTDKFSVGYILKHDNDFVMMEAIDSYGKSDGIICLWAKLIFKIEIGNKYINSISRLFKYHKQVRRKKFDFTNDLLINLLKHIKNENRICAIQVSDDRKINAIGFIVDITENLTIQAIDEHGENDGQIVIDIERITYLSFDSADERKLEILV